MPRWGSHPGGARATEPRGAASLSGVDPAGLQEPPQHNPAQEAEPEGPARKRGPEKRAALPRRAPEKIRSPGFLRMCSEPSRWLLRACQNISLWSHPCFSINKGIFGLLATMSECYKRGRAFQDKHYSSQTPVGWLWAAKCGEQGSYSGALCVPSRDLAQESGLWAGCLHGEDRVTPEQKDSATAIQDPRAFPVQRGPRPSVPAPAGQSAGRAHLLTYRFGSSTTQTEKAWYWGAGKDC